MSQDRVFIGAVLAAALWFVLNPDFKSRSVEAGTSVGVAAQPGPAGASFFKNEKAALANGASREIRENILVELRAKDGGCEATVVEAPEFVGTTLEGPPWDCELAVKIRGSAVFDPRLGRYSGFTPNVGRDDPPYDRAILARWENYGALCPNATCARTDLVVLGDGAVEVRAGPEIFPVDLGKLEARDVEALKSLNASLASAGFAEKRIADPRTSETVAIHLVHAYRANPFMNADFLHASLRYPPGSPAASACRIVQKRTPVRFCELLDEESSASPTPENTGKPPIVVHGPGSGTIPNGTPQSPNSPNHAPVPRPSMIPRAPTFPEGTPTTRPSPWSGNAPNENLPRSERPVGTHSLGMTWNNFSPPNLAAGYVHVSCHGKHECNAYGGDTRCNSVHPMLCIRKDASIAAPALPPELQTVYSSWASAEVRLLPNVSGTSLTSREAADAQCAAGFGAGWRMAEHHDGWGWGFVARGSVSSDDHFWVAINDQPANCWNSR